MDKIQSLVEKKIYADAKKRKCFSNLYVPREMGGLGLVHLRRHVLPALAHSVGRMFEDSDSKPQYVCLRAELNKYQDAPAHDDFAQLSWPMAFAWVGSVAKIGGGYRSGGMPWRWQQYRNAFYSLINSSKSANKRFEKKEVRLLCHAKYRDDPTLPFNLQQIFDVQMPHQLETIGFFTSSFQKRIAKGTSKLVIPRWNNYPELQVEKRWEALWPRASLFHFSLLHSFRLSTM